MSRWITVPCLSLILLTLVGALQPHSLAQADDDLPRNIELKAAPRRRPTRRPQDTSTTDDKTRQIVTEGKDASPAAAPPADAAAKPDTPKEGQGASTAAPHLATPAPEAAAAKEAARPLRAGRRQAAGS